MAYASNWSWMSDGVMCPRGACRRPCASSATDAAGNQMDAATSAAVASRRPALRATGPSPSQFGFEQRDECRALPLRQVFEHDIDRWAGQFLDDLSKLGPGSDY